MSHTQATEQQPEQQHKQQQGEGDTKIPDPEVVTKAKRRTFTAEYKLRIVEEADACTEAGQVGALLRREGLYSSHLSKWRQLRKEGQLQALSAKKRGRKAQDRSASEVAELRQENERLRARLEQTEIIIDVQKKLSRLLGLNMDQTQTIESES
jgi:transposase-like protein